MQKENQKFDITDAIQSNQADQLLDEPLEVIQDTWFKPTNPYAEPVEPLEFIINGMCAKGMLTVIGGRAGTGKSMLTQYLLQLRGNQDLIETISGNAIYLTGADSSETEIRRRAKSIGKGIGLYTVEIPSDRLSFITDQEFYQELYHQVIDYEPDVIVFDTIADFHSGETNDAKDATRTMHAFRILAQKTSCGIILITHTRKSSEIKAKINTNDISDSRIFTTKADFVFGIKSEYQDDSTNLIELQCLKSRSPTIMAPVRALFEYNPTANRFSINRTDRQFEYEKTESDKKEERLQAIKKAKELHTEGLPQREIAKNLNKSLGTINNYLKND